MQITSEEAVRPREGVHGAVLIERMGTDQAAFSRCFKGPAGEAGGRRGLQRIVAVALGNGWAAEVVPVLTGALEDEEPLIRRYAAWPLAESGRRGR